MTVARDEFTPQDRALAEWNAAAIIADEVLGYTLIGGEDNEKTLDMLIGTPFIIEGITFRDSGIPVRGVTVDGRASKDYVSVEALVHPLYQSRFPRPRVVFNDGSTGIYRQIVAYLARKGEVTIDDTLPDSGEAHTTRFDRSFSDSETGKPWSIAVSLVCPEGLRVSEYAYGNDTAKTWYLA